METGSGQPPEFTLDNFARTRNVHGALQALGLTLVSLVKEGYSTPGRGRLRQKEATRLGRGAMRTASVNVGDDAPPMQVSRRVKRGTPRTSIAGVTRASAPGDPPAPDTGALRNSVHMEQVDVNTITVGTPMPYAAPLEFGTDRAGRGRHTVILPRPNWRPNWAKLNADAEDIIAAELKVDLSE